MQDAAPRTRNRSRLTSLLPFSLFPLCLAFVTACATTPAAAPSPDADRRFYEARCGVCHVAYPREHFGPAEWSKVLDVMGPRAGLTKSQRERVLGYVTAR